MTVWFFPALIGLLFPNNRGIIEITALVLPITAFFIRYRVGRRYVASNHCGKIMRRFQVVIFCLGITILCFIDTMMILTYVLPKGFLFRTLSDRMFWIIFYATYLVFMLIAMFPGFEELPEQLEFD